MYTSIAFCQVVISNIFIYFPISIYTTNLKAFFYEI